jgi:phytoene dehydrogenase-like protein
MGTKPNTPLNNLWRTVGALDNSTEILNTECFFQIEEGGQVIKIYRDVNRLESHLLEKSPEDVVLIKDMCKAIRVFQKMEMPLDKPMEMYSPLDVIKLILKTAPLMSYFKKYRTISVEEFALQFKNPLLRSAILNSMPTKNTAFNLICILSSMSTGDNNWPKGGSKAMADRMEKKYLSLGGKIHYHSKVESISVADEKATGIILANGSEHLGDAVISATDGYYCLNHMLKGKYSNAKLDQVFANAKAYPVYTTVQVSLGIACDLSQRPDFKVIKLSDQISAGDIPNEFLRIKHFCYDSTIAAPGKSVITVLLDTTYDWWNEVHKNKELYRLEKEKISAKVSSTIEKIYPETTGKIEKVDVATPATYERYCNAYRGAYMSWTGTPQSKLNFLPMKFKKLKRFYMAGQWTTITGGLPLALITGKWAIQHICKDMGVPFKTIR